MDYLSFYKDDQGWFIDLPEFVGSKAQLQMVEGADTMLDHVSQGGNKVILGVSIDPIEGRGKLVKMQADERGGAKYFLGNWDGRDRNQHMWLCGVTEFVFGDMPDEIYIQ